MRLLLCQSRHEFLHRTILATVLSDRESTQSDDCVLLFFLTQSPELSLFLILYFTKQPVQPVHPVCLPVRSHQQLRRMGSKPVQPVSPEMFRLRLLL